MRSGAHVAMVDALSDFAASPQVCTLNHLNHLNHMNHMKHMATADWKVCKRLVLLDVLCWIVRLCPVFSLSRG